MKKLVVTALLALSVLSLAACGSTTTDEATETTTEVAVDVADGAEAETVVDESEAATDVEAETEVETATEA